MFCFFIQKFALRCSKKELTSRFGKDFWYNFKRLSESWLREIEDDAPKITGSAYEKEYQFGFCYIAWFKAFRHLGLSIDEIRDRIWGMNQAMLEAFPAWLRRAGKKSLMVSYRRSLAHSHLAEQGRTADFDWKETVTRISPAVYEIKVTECGLMKLAKRYGAMDLFPFICRLDYLMADYLHYGFYRTKTLGDGDSCCNCRYHTGGRTKWEPEKNFNGLK